MKKIILGAILSAGSLAAVADDANSGWVGGVGYSTLSQSDDALDISLGALVGSVGYANQLGSNF